MSSTADFDRVQEVFLAVLELPPAERGTYLETRCAGEPDVRREVESLLAFEAAAGESSPAPGLGTDLATLFEDGGPPPDRLGAYRILGVIGEGGMGVVYRAQQDTPRRPVALKVVRPGLLSEATRRRFDLEVEALGRLAHAGIARIYDAGTADTPRGPQPYFAMELVEGVDLVTHVRERALGVRDRVALFVRICDAVHHAHQQAVIHRDLKPSNILVDAGGNPKVLDFGIARHMRGAETDARQTLEGQLVGTLAYMSPEQASRDPAAVDVRSDVYSLGVLLYELLSGELPYDVVGVPVDVAVRTIRETPPRPFGGTVRRLRGNDLETIVAMALRKEKERRYAGASELSVDLGRYLAGQVVLARRASATYVLAKFVRRHWIGVAAGLAVLGALVVGLLVARHERGVATTALADLEREHAQSIALIDTLEGVLTAPDPYARDQAETTVRQLLDESLESSLAQLRPFPKTRARLMVIAGETYGKLGRDERAIELLEGAEPAIQDDLAAVLRCRLAISKSLNCLGRFEAALAVARDVSARRRSLLGPDHEDTVAAEIQVGTVLMDLQRFGAARDVLDSLLARLRSRGAGRSPPALAAEQLVGDILRQTGARRRACEQLRRVASLQREIRGEGHPQTLLALRSYANALLEDGDTAGSLRVLEEAHERQRARFGAAHPATVQTLNLLGAAMLGAERFVDATETLQRVVALQDEMGFARTHTNRLVARHNLAIAYHKQGDHARAIEIVADVRAIRERELGPRHPRTLEELALLARLHRESGRWEDAVARFGEVLPLQVEVLGGRARATLMSEYRLADIELARGRLEPATVAFDAVLAKQTAALGAEDPDTLTTCEGRAMVALRQGELPAAVQLLERVVRGRRTVFGEDDARTLKSRSNLAAVWHRSGNPARAVTAFRDLIRVRERIHGPQHPETVGERLQLGNVLAAMGDYGAALAEAERVRGAIGASAPVAERFLARVQKLLSQAHQHLGDFGAARAALDAWIEQLVRQHGADSPRTRATRALRHRDSTWIDTGVHELRGRYDAMVREHGRNSAQAWLSARNYGVFLRWWGRASEAMAFLETVVSDAGAGAAGARCVFGSVLVDSGHYERAGTVLERAHRDVAGEPVRSPVRQRVLAALARLSAARGDAAAAARYRQQLRPDE